MKPLILFVEDEEAIREIVAESLTDDGFECLQVASGCDALKILEAGRQRFDLLLTDARMPGGISGYQLAERFRALFPYAPVVIMTGHIEDEAQIPVMTGLQVLEKPVRMAVLAQVLAESLTGSARAAA